MDAGPVPATLMAAIVTVYAVPSVRPLMVHGDAVQALELTALPGLPGVGVATIVYAAIAAPPVSSGAAKVRVAAPLDAEIDQILGADGSPGLTVKVRVTVSAAE